MNRLGSTRAVVTLIALAVSTFVYVTTETLPIGLLPLIAADLQTTPSAVGLLVTGYGLVVVAASIPLTRATRRIPRRLLLSVLLGVFVAATTTSALVTSYAALFVARLAIALSQALFWSVVTPAAAGLFDERVRGRAVAILFGGSSLAAVVGVPAGTWLGQVTDWRVAFLAMSTLGLLTLVVVAVLLPTMPAGQGAADHGSSPDAGRYWIVVLTTALAVTGAFTTFTYVSPFLTEVSGFPESATGLVLLFRGIAGVLGVVLISMVIDRSPWLAMTAMIALQGVALTLQYTLGGNPIAAAAAVSAAGLSIAALSTTLGARVLIVAPGSSDLASAGTSTAFNVGITAGSLIGGLLLPSVGARSTALVGAVFTIAALVLVLLESRFSSQRRRRSASRQRATSGSVLGCRV